MIQVLIVDNSVMAFGPFQSTDENLIGPDMVFPKNISFNWKVIESDIPEGSTVSDYFYDDGSKVVKKAPELVKKDVPDSVSPRQIRQALTRVDLRKPVEDAIAAGDQDTKDWYEYATAFERNNPHVIAMGLALGVADAQLDQLWILAGSL